MRQLLSVAALALGALPASSQSTVRAGGPWEVPCPFDADKALLPVTCGRLKVAENPARPGREVELAFMVVRAPQSIDQHGPVVFLNGGPGQVSLHHFERLVTHPHIRDVVVDRDWIFLDQRGTGRSTPSLSCEPQSEWLAEVRTCRDRLVAQGIDLSQYNSVRIAGDLEALRKALGVAHWNLWGISYGARLAVISARVYPTSVRTIVLDAPAVPEGQELIDDARGTEAALHKLFAKCAADSACAAAYPQLQSRFNAALPRLRQQPLSVGERRYDDAALLRFIRNWLYPRGYSTFEQRIQSLLTVMDAAARGDGRTLQETQRRMRVAEGIDTRVDPPRPPHGRYSTGQNLSVFCHESAPFASRELYERAAAESPILRGLLPGFGSDAACSLWPAGKAAPASRTGVYRGPQLLLTGELDASSSGIAGYEIARRNPNAKHVVFRNGMHGQFPTELPTPEDTDYRLCALRLARAFVANPERRLDAACAETRQLRLVRSDSIAPRLQRLADSVVAARPRLPGLIVFVKSGRLGKQWAVAAGRSDTSRNLPLRPEQPLRIASNTKTYVAAAILRLMEQGTLRLSDPLSQHLPQELNTLLERDGYRTSQITIEQVLSHRSGLNEHPAVPSYIESLIRRPEKHWTRLEQVQWLVDSLQPVGAPGERFRYSDTGYILLGAIIERYTGTNLGAGVRGLLGFEKLGLQRTWFETLEPAPSGVAERAHQYINGVDSYQHDPSFDLYGGGGIAAPLEELAGFLEALLQGKVFERRETLDTMLVARSPELGGYGLGIYANTQAGQVGYGHSGFWGTVALHFPKDNLTVAVAVTEQSQYGAIFGVVGAIARMFFAP